MTQSKNPKVIAIDFDQTIAMWSEDDWSGVYTVKTYPKAKPHAGLFQAMKEWRKRGHRLIIYTSRWWGDRNTVYRWLTKNKVPFDDLICGKFKADLFIDDKNANTHYADWRMVSEELLGAAK